MPSPKASPPPAIVRRRVVVKEEPVKEELLTVEGHPVFGRIERWRMSDGTVKEIHLTQTFVEQ